MLIPPAKLKTLRARFLVEHLDLEEATQVEGAKWEHFQLAHLNDDSTFRIEVKSRQIAWSWLSAAEGLVEAMLHGRSSLYISINLEEAKEKIRYARECANALPAHVRPKFTRDSELTLQLANGARLISLPARAARGKSRMNVYMDEFAHVARDRAIYIGSLPVISKGGGRLRMASSPFGASGVFWEILEQKLKPYPDYRRKYTPWWAVIAFCTNVVEAKKLAPTMSTYDRVNMFGRDRIKAIYSNMPEDDFRQEYECEILDEQSSWISWDEIRDVQSRVLCWQAVTVKGNGIGPALELIQKVVRLIAEGKIEDVLAAGVDVGRTRNATEIYLVGKTTLDSYPLRVSITLEATSFEAQRTVLEAILNHLPVFSMLIDHNGIGRNLAEDLEQGYPTKAVGVDFTSASKTLWATNTKMLVQQKKTPIPTDPDLAYQIHSIKRMVTASKNLVFDTAKNEKHHADKFWAWTLALEAARGAGGAQLTVGQNFLQDYRG